MKYQLQNQETFSFDSTSSKTEFFSDDEDGHSHSRGRISGHQQTDGYFEISLPPSGSPLIAKSNRYHDAKEEEFEFCFSFNYSSTLGDFPTLSTSNHLCQPPTTTSSAIAASQTVDAVDKNYNHRHNNNSNSINLGRMFRRASNPRCHQGLISPYVVRTCGDGQPVFRLQTFHENQQEVIRNRNSASLSLGGIRKLTVKLRSIKSMLRSSLDAKSRLLQPSPMDKVNKVTSTDQKQINKIDVRCHMATKSDENNKTEREEKKSSRMMSFQGFTKMLDVITKNITRSKKMGSKSCPVSIKSSSVHVRDEPRNSFYSRDHSVQAAIAHCKKSSAK